MLKAGIFDIGGVLQIQDVNGPLREDVSQTFKVSGEVFEAFRQEMEPYLLDGTIEEQDYWEEFRQRSGSAEKVPEESLLLREYVKNFSINKHVLEVVKEVKSKGIRLACLTDTQKPHTEFNKSKGLYDEFEVQVFSHDVHMRKPNKMIYEYTLNKLGVFPNEAFYVDDREVNLVPARELGVVALLFVSAEVLRKDLVNLSIL